jgi:hypothetical protein
MGAWMQHRKTQAATAAAAAPRARQLRPCLLIPCQAGRQQAHQLLMGQMPLHLLQLLHLELLLGLQQGACKPSAGSLSSSLG